MTRMHIAVIESRQGGKVYRSHLLRRSYRDQNGKAQKQTIANLSKLPEEAVAVLDAHLKGHTLVRAEDAFEILSSRSHGAVQAVQAAFDRLGIPELLASVKGPERDIACAMIAARIIRPRTKLGTTRWWTGTTLPEAFNVADADADDLYAAMDWLLARQSRIEGKLARRHLAEDGLVLLDLSSSWFEGTTCPLARFGHSRDGKRGKRQVNYGLMCDVGGRPVAVSVLPGNVRDSEILLPAVERLRRRFGIRRIAVVGDRGMIVQAAIDRLKRLGGIDWITALESGAVRKLARGGFIDPLDETSLFELVHPDFPGERLVACRNPRLAARRARTREDLLQATEADLDAVRRRVERGTLQGAANIGMSVGEVINRRKVKKHFACRIGDASFSHGRKADAIAREAALDGVYVIRTSLCAEDMEAGECVRSCKSLTRVERAFRTMKTTDLHVRPIHHRTADRVRAHIFLCMLAYYVEWHMREAWRELLFADPELDARSRTRDPVAPAQRSDAGKRKATTKLLEDGTPAHSFRTLIEDLETVTRNTCRARRVPAKGAAAGFEMTTVATPGQTRALNLLGRIGADPQTAPAL